MDTMRSGLADPKGRTIEELDAKVEQLLARIEHERLVSDWCWPVMTETVGQLMDLGDHLRWFVVAYLSAVIVRRDALFKHASVQTEIPLGERSVVTTTCRCGATIEVPQPLRRSGRLVTLMRCGTCRLELVMFDEEPYQRQTLISASMV